MANAPQRLRGHDHGCALVVAFFAAYPRIEACRENARAALRFIDAPGDYFESFSAESSAAFAASIASEINTPGNASNMAFCKSPVGYTRHAAAKSS